MTLLNLGTTPPSPIIVSWWGASRTKYDFELAPVWSRYKARPGVYIFCKLSANGGWNPVYVGQTHDFSGRIGADSLESHHRWPSIRAAGATHICTLHIPNDEALRVAVETDLIHGLNPPCNRQ
jgi:hypothetical protein